MSARYRVLVVDDQPNILHTYALILEKQGYSVTGAGTFGEATRALAGESFDLLLCDFRLEEGHSGLEVIDLALSRSPQPGTVLLTGYFTEELIAETTRRGTVLLCKPLEVPALLRELATLAEQRPAGGDAEAAVSTSAESVPGSSSPEPGSELPPTC